MNASLTWKAEDIIRAVRGHCLQEQAWMAHGVSIDSRAARKGDIFIALQGDEHDGHDHIATAFASGAVAAVASRLPSQIPARSALILVDDTFAALEGLGREGRKRSEARAIAVLGTRGKIDSKNMLQLMLNEVGDTYASQGSFENRRSVPLSLARMPECALYGVFEIGIGRAGELGPLSQQLRPHVAFIPSADAAHPEFFESAEAAAEAQAEIFLGMAPQGAVVLNRDNPCFARLASAAKAQGIKRVLGFSGSAKSDAKLLDCVTDDEGSAIRADILGRKINYRIGVPGLQAAMDSLGALLATAAAGGDVEACAAILTHYRQPKTRGVIQTIALPGGEFTLIDESYDAANAAAVHFTIRTLGQMTPMAEGRRILVLGEMHEPEDSAPSIHADLAQDIIEAEIDSVFCCGESIVPLFGFLPPDLQIGHAKDGHLLARQVASAVQAGDIVTVKGSKRTLTPAVVEALKDLEHPLIQRLVV